MKKVLLFSMCLVMCISLFAACADSDTTDPKSPENPIDPSAQEASDTLLSDEEIAYVMIYNPNIYDENLRSNPKLSTGDFADYVEAFISRGDGLETPKPEFYSLATDKINAGFDFKNLELGESRAGTMIIPYEVGDTKDFYYGLESRRMQTFKCMYAGEYCNVWTFANNITGSEAQTYGREFDTGIYENVVDMFGESRFASNGGKVNILFYPMQNGLGGFFANADLYATGELTEAEVRHYGVNLDHDIININCNMPQENINSTLAHEFQHLICFTNYFETNGYIAMRTWLNESMSGYIEEVLYPGIQYSAGRYDQFCESSRIRHGQSMYNFESTQTNSEWDIGVYGSVYLFSEYLANLAGDDVFSGIHSYWRDSYSSTLDEAEAIVNSVSSDVYNNINDLVDFGGKIDFADENDEWLSKLTLDFYLSLLKADSSDPEAYEKLEAQTLLYDEVNAADIEGGGRVIVALKDGEFKFPEDADKNLVYVGLDKDFKVVTNYVVR